MTFANKLTDEQRAEIARRYVAGETRKALAKDFGVSTGAIRNACSRLGAVRPPLIINTLKNKTADMAEFAHRAKSVLWRVDLGGDKKTYNAWKARVEALEQSGELTHNQAIVRASKEYPCLKRLFREYDVAQYDPNPDSHPDIKHFGQKPDPSAIVNEGREQTYKENLRWAIEAAGTFLRTGVMPATVPNDAAFYLFEQARSEPKDFLSRVGQAESKGDVESEERRSARKAGKKSLAEIDGMLAELESE